MNFGREQVRSAYEAVVYPGYSFAHTRLDNLSTVARLAGMETGAVTGCRVLEIGCAVGRNLLPMAQMLPGSTFLGIDISGRQIEEGQAMIAGAGLGNVELRRQDLMDFGRGEGGFDYIIAHGIYSWTASEVREKLMQVCGRNLTAGGVAYVSYNTLPGWRLKGIARDMALFHGEGERDGTIRIARAKEMLGLAAEESPAMAGYKAVLKAEAAEWASQADWQLFHDSLEAVNEPVYFEQFVRHARGNGLFHLAAAHPEYELWPWLSAGMRGRIEQFTRDEIRREQYLDFLSGRPFRASVLCRMDAKRGVAVSAERMSSLYVAGRLREEPGGAEKNAVTFVPAGIEAKWPVNDGEVIAALRRVAGAWPRGVAFAELTGGDARAAEKLGAHLLSGYKAQFLELWTRATDFIAADTGRPRATALARQQAATEAKVTNLRHESMTVNALVKFVLPLLDGSDNREALVRELRGLFDRGIIRRTGNIAAEEGRDEMETLLDSVLKGFAQDSLLVGE